MYLQTLFSKTCLFNLSVLLQIEKPSRLICGFRKWFENVFYIEYPPIWNIYGEVYDTLIVFGVIHITFAIELPSLSHVRAVDYCKIDSWSPNKHKLGVAFSLIVYCYHHFHHEIVYQDYWSFSTLLMVIAIVIGVFIFPCVNSNLVSLSHRTLMVEWSLFKYPLENQRIWDIVVHLSLFPFLLSKTYTNISNLDSCGLFD